METSDESFVLDNSSEEDSDEDEDDEDSEKDGVRTKIEPTSTTPPSFEDLGLVEVTEDSTPSSFENVISSRHHNDGSTELHFAVATGNEEVVEELLKHSFTVDEKDEASLIERATTDDQRTVLHIAASLNQERMVKLLLRYGANVNRKAKYGLTPLHFAAIKGHVRVVNLLLQEGSNPWTTLVSPQKEHAPLHLAAINGRYEAFVALFEWMNQGLEDAATNPLLFGSSTKKKRRLVWKRKSTKEKSSKNKEDKRKLVDLQTTAERTTLLHCAVVGCEIESTDGRTTDEGTREGSKIVHYLLQHGVNPCLVTTNGWTALHLAAALGSKEACRVLLQPPQGVDVTNGKALRRLLNQRTSGPKKLKANDVARLRGHLELSSYLDQLIADHSGGARTKKQRKKEKTKKEKVLDLKLLEEDPD